LPGHISGPKQAISEIRDAEALGFGSVWISERFSGKNADVLSGVAAMLAPSMGIASGLIQNVPPRHLIVTAGYAATMAKLTDDRFALAVGRGTNSFADSTGTPRQNFKIMQDDTTVPRQVWRGERVNYEGPQGKFTNPRLGVDLPKIPPVIMAGMGEKTLKWAGKFCLDRARQCGGQRGRRCEGRAGTPAGGRGWHIVPWQPAGGACRGFA
jgi:alkanesulfonate monooxygenase SsuD/methylene tetrahydromethanopterin reductase-like flavin-dependent oxidoreductase (luciferase family)